MSNITKDEYYFLTDKLDEINWALDGKCNDIDCNKYMYKDLLKKRYKPILKHSFSCINKLKREKEVIMRLLSQKKFRKYRFKKCNVCGKLLDKLDEKNCIVSFTKLIEYNNQKAYQWNCVWAHNRCKSHVKIPSGWKKFL